MDTFRCRSCGRPYTPGEDRYCPSCGDPLATPDNLAKEVRGIEDEPKPYSALRFTSSLIIFGGWAVIIVGWFLVFLWFSVISSNYSQVTLGGQQAERIKQNLDAIPLLLPFVIGFINTLFGIIVIGCGQVFAVVLDIRDDMHTTTRLVRRFGLLMSKDAGPTVSKE